MRTQQSQPKKILNRKTLIVILLGIVIILVYLIRGGIWPGGVFPKFPGLKISINNSSESLEKRSTDGNPSHRDLTPNNEEITPRMEDKHSDPDQSLASLEEDSLNNSEYQTRMLLPSAPFEESMTRSNPSLSSQAQHTVTADYPPPAYSSVCRQEIENTHTHAGYTGTAADAESPPSYEQLYPHLAEAS
ncbi:hypothetical protein NEAUS06_2245 [Nematocida ausubeli]|nr:hypothetical protein NEAUS06_2245 [Nematocida ausubeli]